MAFLLHILFCTTIVLFITQSNGQLLKYNRYVITNNSYYKPYELVFNKKTPVKFTDQYKNRYLFDYMDELKKNITDIRVCFENVVQVQDPALLMDVEYQDSRLMAEYCLSKISKYTNLKFWLLDSNVKCQLTINFNKTLPPRHLAMTYFRIRDGTPFSEVLINYNHVQETHKARNISLMKLFLQTLMHEILHGLGIDHSIDDPNAKSIMRSQYDASSQQLLYKKDVYILRSLYGVRKGFMVRLNTDVGVVEDNIFMDPSDWESALVERVKSYIASQNRTMTNAKKSK